MMRWSKVVVPFSTIAVPEAMLEILPLAAVFTTCIQISGISGAIYHQGSIAKCSRSTISPILSHRHGSDRTEQQQHWGSHLTGPGAGGESQLPIVVEQPQSQGWQLLRQQQASVSSAAERLSNKRLLAARKQTLGPPARLGGMTSCTPRPQQC